MAVSSVGLVHGSPVRWGWFMAAQLSGVGARQPSSAELVHGSTAQWGWCMGAQLSGADELQPRSVGLVGYMLPPRDWWWHGVVWDTLN